MLVRSLACALALVLSLPALAVAAPSWLPTVALQGTSQGLGPRVAMAPGGATVAGWADVVDGEPVIRAAFREPGGAFATTTIDVATTEIGYGQSVAISPRGTAIVAWSQKDDAGKWRVAAAIRPAGGAWGSPQLLSGPGANPPEPAAAVGGNDDAWVIWHRTAISTELVEGIRRSPAGVWSGVENLSATGTASRTRLVMDQAGNATAAWVSAGASNEIVTAVRPVGGAWSAPTAPSDSTSSGDYPDLAVGPQGRVALVWKRLYPISETRAAFRDPGGAWSDSTIIGGVSSYPTDAPRVAVDALGGVTAAWSMGFNVDVNWRPAGGAWAAATSNLSVGAFSDAYSPNVAGGPAGEAIVAWHATSLQQGNRIQVRLRDGAGSWGVVQDIAGELSSGAAVAMDDQGNAFVAWRGASGVKGRAYDVAGPDLGAPAPAAPLVAGVEGELAVAAADRWSALGPVSWDLGDGTARSGAVVRHTYAAPGTYRVVVTAADALGSVKTRAADVVVAAPKPPEPPFVATPTPTPPPTATPTATPTPPPKPPAKTSRNRSIRFSRGYVTPGVSRAKACRGSVRLTLKSGKRVLGRKTARLDRKCRYAATFTVRRSLLDGRRSVTVIVRFGGNKYLGATTNRFTIQLTDD